MIKLLAVKTELGYYKNGDPYLIADFHRASVYPTEQVETVRSIMTTLQQRGLESTLVEMTVTLIEWPDVSSWLGSAL